MAMAIEEGSDPFSYRFFKDKKEKQYSDVFIRGGIKWYICMHPNSEGKLYIALGLAEAKKLQPGWTTKADFEITLVNHLNRFKSLSTSSKGTPKLFSKDNFEMGSELRVPLSKLCCKDSGYLKDEMFLLEVIVKVDRTVNTLENASAKDKELQPFRDFGVIPKEYVPLLEEACSMHPSLVDQLQGGSPTNTLLVLLGEILHLLKTTKLREMTEDGWKHLQKLWVGLDLFMVDLEWLKLDVQAAFGMKEHVEKARKLKRKREEVGILDKESNRLKHELDVTQLKLELIRKELRREEDGFVPVDLDWELGRYRHFYELLKGK